MVTTTNTSSDCSLNKAIISSAQALYGAADDYDSLLDLIGDARIVLLGEASHGTQEFYAERIRITQRLIAEKDFVAVAVEGDWPDAYRVNRYVRKQGVDGCGKQALAGFKRFPAWMWRNTEVVAFVEWLRNYNDSQPPGAPGVGFYGLDLYSLFASIDEILRYLNKIDPEAAQRARKRYACFDHFDDNSQRYGYATGFGMRVSCEAEVIAQLRELLTRSADYLRRDGSEAKDAFFYAEQNARLIVNAEEYYRTMFRSRISSWNLRERHMAETLDALALHLSDTEGKPAKIVVWEHNSHIGDARATDVSRRGEWNVGQLTREFYGEAAKLIGFTTYQGTVTAASDWNALAARKRLRPALDGSYEEIFHRTGLSRFMLPLSVATPASQLLSQRRLERAIGVIYLPEAEQQSHYFYACLPQQFDAVLHFDETHAVEPLELGSNWEIGEAPETFPVGF